MIHGVSTERLLRVSRCWWLRPVPVTVGVVGMLTEDDYAQDRPEVEGLTRLKEVPHQTEGEADHKTSHCPHDDLDGSLGIHTTILMWTFALLSS